MTISFAPLDTQAVTILSERTGIDFGHVDFAAPNWLCATSRQQRKIDGIFVAEFTSWFEAHWTCVVDNPRIVSRRLLKAIFSALFSQAVRVTAMTRPDNVRAVRGIRRLGFSYEGYCRLGIEGRWDALVFGMLRDECPWLGKPSPVFARNDKADGGLGNSVTTSKRSLSDDPSQRPDFPDLLLGQLDPSLPLTPVGGAVQDAVSLVVSPTGPAQMSRIEAGAVATTVGHVIADGPRSINPLADENADRLNSSFAIDDSIALMPTEGHFKTGRTIINNSLFQKPLGFSVSEV